MKCLKCGKENTAGVKFCDGCGAKFEENKANETSQQTQQNIPPNQNNFQQPPNNPYAQPAQNVYMVQPKKKRGCLIAFLVTVGIVVLIFIIAIATSGGGDSGSKPSSNAVTPSSSIAEETDKSSSVEESKVEEDSSNTDSDEEPEYIPTAYDIFEALQENGVVSYTMTEKAQQFLVDNDKLFPTKKETAAKAATDYDIKYKHLDKNVSKYGDKLMYVEGAVVQIDEVEWTEDIIISTINMVDSAGDQYYVFFIGEIKDIFNDDYITIYGLPLDMSQYDNIGGGVSLVSVLAGSYVSEIE